MHFVVGSSLLCNLQRNTSTGDFHFLCASFNTFVFERATKRNELHFAHDFIVAKNLGT